MSDNVEGNIHLNIDTSEALAQLRRLEAGLSKFHTNLARGSATANLQSAKMQQTMIDTINQTGRFSAGMTKIQSTTEAFTSALEKNKLSMGQYFRYSAGALSSFGGKFSSEFNTITKVATERVKDLQTRFISMGRDANGALQAIKVRPLTLDMKDLGTQTQIAAQKHQIFNELIGKGSTAMLNWGKNTQWAGRQLMVGFTIPLGIFATTAAKSFMEMEKQVIALKRVYGDFNTTVQETDQMVAQIRTLSTEFTKYGVAVQDTMKLAADAAAMGKVGADLVAQVSDATKLAVLGGVSQQDALQTTISLTNAFGTASKDLAGNIDFLNAVENQTVTSISDLTEAIPKAAPVIKQLGGDVKDLSFLLTAMREGGINASEGANALKSGLASLINPTKTASDMLAGYGINIQQMVQADKGDVKKLIVDFAGALDKLDPLERSKAIEQMFGKFQFARISTLFKNVIDQGSQANRVLQLANASNAQLAVLSQRELDKVSESTTYKFQKAYQDFQNALQPIGEQFLKMVTPIIEWGTSVLEAFNKMGDGAKNFIGWLTVGIGGIAPSLLMIVGLFANMIANIIKVGSWVGRVFGKAGKDTADLASQTTYMSESQIRAETVAASLNQVHGRLIQTFSSETAAVVELGLAYEAAAKRAGILQGVGFFGPVSGKRTAARKSKFASGGVVRGAGTGTSDSILAMVSNGEAIIPAKQTKKHMGLIKGLIAGKFAKGGIIPGYVQGTAKVRGRRNLGEQQSYLRDMGYGKEVDALMKLIHDTGIKSEGAIRKLFSDLSGAASKGSAVFKETLTTATSTLKVMKDASITAGDRLTNATRLGIHPVTGAIDPKVAPRMQSINPQIGGGRPVFAHIGSGVTMSAAQFKKNHPDLYSLLPAKQQKEVDDLIAKKDKAGISIKSGLGLAGFSDVTNRELAAQGATTSGFLKSFSQAGVGKWSQSIEMAGGNTKELSTSVKALDARMKEIIKSSKASVIFDSRAQAAAHMAANPGAIATSVEAAYAQARAELRKSHPELFKALDTAHRTGTEVRVSGHSPGSAARTRARSGGIRSASADRALATAADEEVKTSARRSKTAKIEEETAKRQSESEKRAAAARKGWETRRANAANATPEVAPKQTMGQRAKGFVGRNAGMVAGAALAGAAFMPGMENLTMPLMVLGSILPMISGPAMGVIAAFGSLGVFTWALIDAQNKAKQAGIDLADSMIMTNDKLTKLSEVTGTVSASETRKANQAAQLTAFNNTAQDTTIGGQILSSDFGKKLLEDINRQVSSGIPTSGIGENIATQLSYAIAQGVLSPDQAKSISAELGIQLKNYPLSASIDATLRKIIGPNGENLAEDPLKVMLDIQQSSSKQQSDMFNKAVSRPTPERTATTDTRMTAGASLFALAGLSAATGVGLIATIPLAIAGLTSMGLALWDQNTAIDSNNKLQQASIELGIQQISQNQGLLDSLNAQYDAKEAEARANIDSASTTKERRIAEQQLNDIIAQRATDTEKLKTSNDAILSKLIAQKSQIDPNVFNSAIAAQASTLYPEGAMKVFADQAAADLAKLSDTGPGASFKATLQLGFASGEFDPIVVSTLVDAATQNKDIATNFDANVKAYGTAESNQILQLLLKGGVAPTNLDAVLAVTANDPTAKAALDAIASSGMTINLSVNADQTLANVGDMISQLDAAGIKDGSSINFEMIGDLKAQDPQTWSQIYDNWTKIVGSDNSITREVLIRMGISINDPDLYANYLRDVWGGNVSGGIRAIERGAAVGYGMNTAVSSSNTTSPKIVNGTTRTPVTGGGTGGGGGGSSAGSSAPKEDKILKRLNRRIDPLNKAMTIMGLKEDIINKKYEERVKALEKIQNLQKAISEQQRDQLDVASAIASGDIAAAAKAAQQMRANNATRAAEDQQKALEASKQAEIDRLTVDGKTKKELEDAIAALRMQIAERELVLSKRPAPKGSRGGGTSSGGTGTGSGGFTTTRTAKPSTDDVGWTYKFKNGNWVLSRVKGGGVGYHWDNKNDKWVKDAKSPASGTFTATTTGKNFASIGSVVSAMTPTTVAKTVSVSGTAAPVKAATYAGAAVAPKIDMSQIAASVNNFTGLTLNSAGKIVRASNGMFGPLTNVADRMDGLTNKARTTAGGIDKQATSTDALRVNAALAKDKIGLLNDKVTTLKTVSTGTGAPLNEVAKAIAKAAVVAGRMSADTYDRLFASGGMVFAKGGSVPTMRSYFAVGGKARGTDTVPAMLTPGEFVVRRHAVQQYGVDKLKAINSGTNPGDSVYTYNVSVNVSSNSNPDEIARVVMQQIKQTNSYTLRGNRF